MHWFDIQSKEQFHEIEYQTRLNGNAVGNPETIVIDCNPHLWRSQQCAKATLLSSRPISREEFMLRSLTGEAVLDGLQ